jgi:hypothetical protein
MDKPNGIEEIIFESMLCHTSMANRGECEQEVKELVLAIKEYYLGLLPKEEDMHYTGEQQHDILRDIRNEYGAGRNSAIQEMRDKIKGRSL